MRLAAALMLVACVEPVIVDPPPLGGGEDEVKSDGETAKRPRTTEPLAPSPAPAPAPEKTERESLYIDHAGKLTSTPATTFGGQECQRQVYFYDVSIVVQLDQHGDVRGGSASATARETDCNVTTAKSSPAKWNLSGTLGSAGKILRLNWASESSNVRPTELIIEPSFNDPKTPAKLHWEGANWRIDTEVVLAVKD